MVSSSSYGYLHVCGDRYVIAKLRLTATPTQFPGRMHRKRCETVNLRTGWITGIVADTFDMTDEQAKSVRWQLVSEAYRAHGAISDEALRLAHTSGKAYQ